MGVREVGRRNNLSIRSTILHPQCCLVRCWLGFFRPLVCAPISRRPAFPSPRLMFFCPCLDCAHHTHCLLTSRLLVVFCRACCFNMLVCISLTNVIPFNSCIYRGPADTLMHTTSPYCDPSFILFGCLPLILPYRPLSCLLCILSLFFSILFSLMIYLNSLTLRLFPNLYNCN